MFKTKLISLVLLGFVLEFCHSGKSSPKELSENEVNETRDQDSILITKVQEQTFQYFWNGAEENSGMGRERYHVDDIYPRNDKHVVTTGGSGFGLMALIVGMERQFISRESGIHRIEKIVDFLSKADRFHGAWSHWIDGTTGKTVPFGKKDNGGDLVETAFLIQGLLSVRQYLNTNVEKEATLHRRIDQLWKEVEWTWYQNGKNVLYWHWSPEYGWEKNFPVSGYNECLIMYILAASSPTYAIDPIVYHEGWAKSGKIKSDSITYGYELVLHHNGSPMYGGPLFWAHYSYLGLDPRTLKDQYADYWKLNQNHALINYNYCVENPKEYEGYGPSVWGLTSSYTVTGYAGHSPKRDLGVISPTAALSSFPYTPEESMAFLKYLYNNENKLVGVYGPYDAFSLEHDWVSERYLAIDQGPIPVMIENYRTGLIWNLFMSTPEISTGLKRLGFEFGHAEE